MCEPSCNKSALTGSDCSTNKDQGDSHRWAGFGLQVSQPCDTPGSLFTEAPADGFRFTEHGLAEKLMLKRGSAEGAFSSVQLICILVLCGMPKQPFLVFGSQHHRPLCCSGQQPEMLFQSNLQTFHSSYAESNAF